MAPAISEDWTDPPDVARERRLILDACRTMCERPDCPAAGLCENCRGELTLEAAVNSRLAFRALGAHARRITILERGAWILSGITAFIVVVIVPLAVAILGGG